MTSSVARVVVSLALAVALFLVVRAFRTKPVAPSTAAPTHAAAAQAPAARAAQISQAPRPALQPPKENPYGAECISFFNELRAIDLADFSQVPPRVRTLPSPATCEKAGDFQDLHDHYFQHCAGVKWDEWGNGPVWANRTKACLSALTAYRAKLTDWLTRDVPLAEIRDPQVLSDKLFARFAEDPVASVAIAERLLEVEPGLYAAAKAAAMGRFFGAAREGTPEAWEKAKAGLDRAKRMVQDGASDDARQIGEMEASAVAMQAKNVGELAKHGESMSREKPEWGTGPYLQALAAFKAGDQAGAVAHLKEAARREPHSEQYRQTMDCLSTTGKDCFRGSASFKLDLSPK